MTLKRPLTSSTHRYLIRISLSVLLLLAWNSRADVSLPAIFSDHMVLQADVAARVWGWAAPGEQVSVTIGNKTQSAIADAAGKWTVKLKSLKSLRTSAQPGTLMVKGATNTLVVHDVLVGEVWLGSGQSNMEWPVKQAKNFPLEQTRAEFPQIRMFIVQRHPSTNALDDVTGRWEVCTSNTVGNFSAALYFFGRELHQALKRPVGLIHSSWGGTPIQPWMPLETLQAYPGYAALLERKQKEIVAWPVREKQILASIRAWEAEAASATNKTMRPKPWNPGPPDSGQYLPTGLYNGMIHPLIGYALRGVVWYQGESNANDGSAGAVDYTDLQGRMIAGWRAAWAMPKLPFLFVQLPNWNNPGDASKCGWAFFREAQAGNLNIPHTGMAVTIDIGEADSIHPRNKQDVGHRLAMCALADVYRRNNLASGPHYAQHKVRGAEIILSFRHTDGGMVAKGGDLKSFVVAGADRKWHPAKALIAGGRVVVSAPEVTAPLAVRYAWADNPDCNLYNGAGLPAAPFRTDDWE